ncbi:cation diffusion facilitator family transporter [Fimbriiglobus ruber]|uniref:Cobalt-zinc-cadmium resistance protein n=1 Tax=Fimbriiglobus ruber TaxID=1908690 RepID=A0A225DUV9_9BACT|nr:cation diffusion facilitator family transporter [Fimbriiglobus ruber]OWK45121.1 Cobalt-zinc-cadmium resistance protein [Fimbriiglobus ruber]
MTQPNLRGPITLSILAAVLTIGMKAAAYLISGSVGLLADALESGINLIAAVTAYFSLSYAARPADATHTYGHEKIEFFSSGLEGALICVAGLGAAVFAASHLIVPPALEAVDLAAGIAAVATVINLVVGRILLRAGRAHGSIVLEADGQHLMADVWTTGAVVTGLGLVALTGFRQLDPILALGVGLHIVYMGSHLVRRSFDGLMDHALPPDEQATLRDAIRAALPRGTDFHHLRTRRAGRRKFADFHLLVAGTMSVRDAHALAHHVESHLHDKIPELEAAIHIEPIDEDTSWEAAELARLGEPPTPTAAHLPPAAPPIDD